MEQDPSLWAARIVSAEKYYQAWSKKYKTNELEKYYEGFQWANDDDSRRYVINLFYSTIEIKVPSLLFTNPIFHFTPKPSAFRYDSEGVFDYCLNREDALNTWLTDSDNHFSDEMEDIAYDIWFRFGVVEIGYSADWIDNPAAQPAPLSKDYEIYSKNPYRKLKRVPRQESLYIKHIPSDTFRVSTSDNKYTERCSWVGYYEYIRFEDILAEKKFKNLDKFEWSGYHTDWINSDNQEDELKKKGLEYATNYAKVWHIWDNRLRRKILYAESQNLVIFEEDFELAEFPLVDIRMRRRKKSWYPLPLAFNWISPQNEQNEIREAHRTHRRRFKRIYQVRPGSIDQDNKQILLYGPDGSVVESAAEILPVANADLGQSATLTLQTSKDDFNIISGTSSEQRGEGDRTTATQAAITNNRSQIRETRERVAFANFLCKVAKKASVIMQKNFVMPMMVESQQQQPAFSDINTIPQQRFINPLSDLGDDLEFRVNIDLDSISPIANEDEKKKFLEFLALLAQYPQFSLSPTLIQELAFRTGYRNMKVIKEFQQFAQLRLMAMVEQAQGALAQQGGGGNLANNTVKQMQPPTGDQVISQLQNQGIPIGQ